MSGHVKTWYANLFHIVQMTKIKGAEHVNEDARRAAEISKQKKEVQLEEARVAEAKTSPLGETDAKKIGNGEEQTLRKRK